MKRKPLVSIIIPFYNEEKFIKKAIESIQNQTYNNIEIITIDDYSTDQSPKIVSELAKLDSRIKVFSKPNGPKRAGISRNIGISLSKGEYIAFQDADDFSHNSRIEKQIKKALEKPNKTLVGTCVVIETVRKKYFKYLPEKDQEIRKGLKKLNGRGNYFVMGTALGPKHFFLNNPSKKILRYVEDWDQLLRITENEDVELYNLQEPLYTWNQVGGLSGSKKGWIESNLFVRFSQRMRSNNIKDPDSKEELFNYLRNNPVELIFYRILQMIYLIKIAWKILKSKFLSL